MTERRVRERLAWRVRFQADALVLLIPALGLTGDQLERAREVLALDPCDIDRARGRQAAYSSDEWIEQGQCP